MYLQGLLLDLDAATLTVWVNGERKGVMVHNGMTDEAGESVGRLEGPLRWAVELSTYTDAEGMDTSVAMAGPLPLRSVMQGRTMTPFRSPLTHTVRVAASRSSSRPWSTQ